MDVILLAVTMLLYHLMVKPISVILILATPTHTALWQLFQWTLGNWSTLTRHLVSCMRMHKYQVTPSALILVLFPFYVHVQIVMQNVLKVRMCRLVYLYNHLMWKVVLQRIAFSRSCVYILEAMNCFSLTWSLPDSNPIASQWQARWTQGQIGIRTSPPSSLLVIYCKWQWLWATFTQPAHEVHHWAVDSGRLIHARVRNKPAVMR